MHVLDISPINYYKLKLQWKMSSFSVCVASRNFRKKSNEPVVWGWPGERLLLSDHILNQLIHFSGLQHWCTHESVNIEKTKRLPHWRIVVLDWVWDWNTPIEWIWAPYMIDDSCLGTQPIVCHANWMVNYLQWTQYDPSFFNVISELSEFGKLQTLCHDSIWWMLLR